MDAEHRNALLRIHQAESAWRGEGQASRSFLLRHPGGMRSEIDHPRWDRSWAAPSEHTIDDLADLALVRVESRQGKARAFVLTLAGRQTGAALAEQQTIGTVQAGRAPAANVVLEWLVNVDAGAPECFDAPQRLLDRAVDENFIDATAREALARRILDLRTEGYLSGCVVPTFGSTAQQTLENALDLALTMQAHSAAASGAGTRTINVFGDVIDSQVATGDITSYTTFVELLDRASQEIDALDDVDHETKREAKTLLERLGRKATSASGDVATGAAGELAAGVLARLVGLPLV